MNLTADSHQYIKIARQIYQNGFINISENENIAYRPPLYPIILSFLLDSEGYISIKFFHYLLGLSLFFIWDIISFDILKNKRQHLLFMVLLSISTNMVMISVFIWSELLFFALFSLVILIVKKYIGAGNIYWILLSIIPAFLMLIQRNAGIFLISAFYFSIIALKSVPLKQLKIIGLSYLLSISGFLIWNVQRILMEDRTHIIAELLPYFTPAKNYMLTVNEIGAIFYPSLLLFPFSIFFTTVVLVMLCYFIFKLADSLFLKILFLSVLLYLSIWIIIPGDPSEMGRFISVVSPILLLSIVKGLSFGFEKMKFHAYFKSLIFSIIILYSVFRVTNNSLLWGGFNNYLNFGEIHNNSFYEKSDRVIGRPSSD